MTRGGRQPAAAILLPATWPELFVGLSRRYVSRGRKRADTALAGPCLPALPAFPESNPAREASWAARRAPFGVGVVGRWRVGARSARRAAYRRRCQPSPTRTLPRLPFCRRRGRAGRAWRRPLRRRYRPGLPRPPGSVRRRRQPSRVEPCRGYPSAGDVAGLFPCWRRTSPLAGLSRRYRRRAQCRYRRACGIGTGGRNRKPFPFSPASWCPEGRRSGAGPCGGSDPGGPARRAAYRRGSCAVEGAVSAR